MYIFNQNLFGNFPSTFKHEAMHLAAAEDFISCVFSYPQNLCNLIYRQHITVFFKHNYDTPFNIFYNYVIFKFIDKFSKFLYISKCKKIYSGLLFGNYSPSGSNIYIDNGYDGNVYGGKVDSGAVENNKIYITGGTILGTVGNDNANVVSQNKIYIDDGIIGNDKSPIYFCNGISEVSNNIINITGGTIIGSNICTAYSQFGNITGNELNISGGKIIGSVRAATGFLGSVKGNTIKISGDADLEEAELIGVPIHNGQDSDNNLTIDSWSGNVKSVGSFNNINFKGIEWQNGSTVLNITANADSDSLADTKINHEGMIISGGNDLAIGESMTLIKGQNLGIVDDNVADTGTFTAGVAVEGTGQAQVTDNGNSVTYEITSLKQNNQVELVAENRAVAAAFVNQGTDLINDSLDVLSRDGKYGIKTFAAVHGNRSKYDVNSDLKINGWSSIVGVGNEKNIGNGDFSWGVFYENGSGNYRTYNEFNNEFFRGDGSLVYNGGGIAARFEQDNGVYTEGSLRAGMLKSEMTNALKDGTGNSYGYKSESIYYGAHIGVGKIISLNEATDLDVYGKFFHTYTDGDSFTVANDKFEFDSITSDRLRIGARLTTNKENKFSTYYGLAYEYEFNGDADMRAQNMSAPEQSLKGSSCMAEIGMNYKPSSESPWSFDLSMRGYAGQRDGFSGNVQATYTF